MVSAWRRSSPAGREVMNDPLESQHRLDAPEALADAVLVLDQCEAYMAVAIVAKADDRRYRDFSIREQPLGKFQRAEGAKALRDRRPHVHGGLGRLDRPSRLVQALDQHIAPGLVFRGDIPHA